MIITIAGQAIDFQYIMKGVDFVLTSGTYIASGRPVPTGSLKAFKVNFDHKIREKIMEEVNAQMEVVGELVGKGFDLKNKIASMTEELRQINKQVEDMATYKAGSKTGHLIAGGIRVKVSRRDNVKWDQEKLNEIHKIFPEEFVTAFSSKWEPISAKALEAAMAQNQDIANGIEWAREIKPGAPTVTYEQIDIN